MYPGMPNSPQTELAQAIDDQTTTIPLVDASKLPPAPNLATIGVGEDAETILYTGKSGNNLTGVTRGFQGAAKAWVQGTKVARNFTAYDYDALRENLEDHAAATTSVHGATSAATPNTIVQRDSAGRFKAAVPVAADDVARKEDVDYVASSLMHHSRDDLNVFPCHVYYCIAWGTANNYFVDLSGFGLSGTPLTDGLAIAVQIPVDNTGPSRLTVGLENPRPIKKPNGNDVAAGNLKAGSIYTLRYSMATASFILQGEVSDFSVGGTIFGELSIQAPGTNPESAINLIDNTGIRQGRLFYNPNNDRVVFRKYAPSSGISADVMFNESVFMYRVGSTFYNVWHSGNVPIETGTWTPELRFGGSTAGITYTNRMGRYTRIANVVYWSFHIWLTSKGSATGAAEIAGLPFARSGDPGFLHAVGRANIISVQSGEWLSSNVFDTRITLYTRSGIVISNADFANTSELGASGFYFI